MAYRASFTLDDDGRIVNCYTLPTGNELTVYAENVRRERTGVHALIGITLNQHILGFDEMNVARDAERVRLGNAAQKQMPQLDAADWPATFMKRALDEFALGLWPYFVKLGQSEVCEYGYGGDLPELDYLLWPHVMAGAGTIVFAPPGRGKTWVALLMGCAVHHGLAFPWRCRQAPVLYVNLERDSVSMERRQRAAYDALGLDNGSRGPYFLHARGRSLIDVAEVIRATIKRHGVELVILDSLTRAGYGDLTENLTANRSADALNGFGVAWVAIGHTPRGDDTHLFGSQMFDAAADFTVALLSDDSVEGHLGIELRQMKNNHGRKSRPEVFALDFDAVGLNGIRVAQAAEFPELAAREHKPPKARVYDHLAATGWTNASDVSAALHLSRSFVSEILNTGERAGELVKRRIGHSIDYALASVGTDTSPTTQRRESVLLETLSRETTTTVSVESAGAEACAECGKRISEYRFAPGGGAVCADCWERLYASG